MPAHFDDSRFVRCARNAPLHKTADAAVFHGYEAGRTNKIGLLKAYLMLMRGIVLKAEYRPAWLRG